MNVRQQRRVFELTTELLNRVEECRSVLGDDASNQVDAGLDGIVNAVMELRCAPTEDLEARVKHAMRQVLTEEPFGINPTQLAEMVADQLDIDDALDDDNHPIWDWSVEAVEESEEEDDDGDEEDEDDDR